MKENRKLNRKCTGNAPEMRLKMKQKMILKKTGVKICRKRKVSVYL